MGAAESLVEEGVNGGCFDAEDVGGMGDCLTRMAGLDGLQREKLGTASVRILEVRCPTKAFGQGLAEVLKG